MAGSTPRTRWVVVLYLRLHLVIVICLPILVIFLTVLLIILLDFPELAIGWNDHFNLVLKSWGAFGGLT
jgi:hypothetical protein